MSVRLSIWKEKALHYHCLILLMVIGLGGFFFKAHASDGTLGPQLFFKQETQPVVLIPSQGAMDILPRQNLWSPGLEGWVSYKGWLSSTLKDQDELLLVYRKTIFAVGEDLKLQLRRKAPSGLFFLATSSAEPEAPILVKKEDGDFASISSGNMRPFPFLSPYSDRFVLPWSSSRYPFLYFPRQKDQDEPVLCAFDPGFNSGRPFDQGLIGFSLVGISENSDGVILLGAEGKSLVFDGASIKPTKLPAGISADGLVSFSNSGAGISALYRSEDGQLSLAISGGNTVVLPSMEPVSQVQIDAARDVHLQSIMMFGVMMVALFMVLRWRQESEEQLPGKVEVVSANLWLRSFAFIMDFFLLTLPVTSIGTLLGVDALPLTNLSHLSNLPEAKVLEFLSQFLLENLKMVAILVVSAIVYHVSLEQWLGGSFGKLFFRIKVVDAEGNSPSLKASFIKALWRSLDVVIFPLISFLAAVSHPDRLSFGDRFSGLRVVQIRRT